MRKSLLHSTNLSQSERRRELASILARGTLRLRQRRVLLGNAGHVSSPKSLPNSAAAGLELSPDTVLSVTNPVNGPESPTLGEPA
jgi:hypothetical protein